MSQKLSGAMGRKRRMELEKAHEKVMVKVPKLTQFFNKTQAPLQTHESEVIAGENDTNNPNDNQDLRDNQNDYDPNENNARLVTAESTVDEIKGSDYDIVNSLFSHDPSTWPEFLTGPQRDQLVLAGPNYGFFQSDKDYPRNSQSRHFFNEYQFRRPVNGERVHRRWLIYSQTGGSIFCFCCRLYAINLKSQLAKKSGFNDWKHVQERLISHETSPEHFKCMAQWTEAHLRLNKNSAIDQELIDQVRRTTERWQEILKRIVEIILYLAQHNIAFRGSSCKLFTPNNGNFLGLVQLLGKFDSVMMEHLRPFMDSDRKHSVHMLSPSIQNEFICLMGRQVKLNIAKKIKRAKYFSVIMDCTPDASHQEQTSLTIRYVDEDPAQDGPIRVEESFINYRIIKQSTGESLSNLLIDEISDCGLNMEDCRGQGYDNGANMKGIHKGVQARILEEYPLATFIPCACHSLNLVISDGAKSSVKSVSLFGILQRIFVMFSASTKRWCIISDHVKGLTLKQVCETRWEARINSITAVLYQYSEILEALLELSETVDDPKISSEAQSLITHFEDFSFLVCLKIWHTLLFQVNLVSKTLQGKTADVSLAVIQIEKCIEFVDNYRENGFNQSIIDVQDIAENAGILCDFPKKRRAKKKKQFSYESTDNYEVTPEEEFSRDIFYPLIDTVSTSLKERFSQLNEHKKKWGFLFDLNHLPGHDQLKMCCQELENYLTRECISDINGTELYNELQHVGSIIDEEMKKTQATPLKILNSIKKSDHQDLFTNLWIALRILLTIPVTVASGERSFSKLKLIKTYLRSSMSQERLVALATLSIENEEARDLNFQELIKSFAESKARKVPL